MNNKYTKFLAFFSILLCFGTAAILMTQTDKNNLFETDSSKLLSSNNSELIKMQNALQKFEANDSQNYLILEATAINWSEKQSIEQLESFLLEVEEETAWSSKSILSPEFSFEKEGELIVGNLTNKSLSATDVNKILSKKIFQPKLINKELTKVFIYLEGEQFSDQLLAAIRHIAKKSEIQITKTIHQDLIQAASLETLGREAMLSFLIGFLLLLLINLSIYNSPVVGIVQGIFYIGNLSILLLIFSKLGLKLNILSVSLPIILCIIQISLGSHLIHRLNEFNSKRDFIHKNKVPIFVSLSTTFVGFASLILADSPLLVDYSVTMMIAVGITGASYLLFLSSLPTGNLRLSRRDFEFFEFSPLQSKFHLKVFSVVVALGLSSYFLFNWEGKPTGTLPDNHSQLIQLEDYIDKTRGYHRISVVVNSDEDAYFENIEAIEKLESLENWISANPKILRVQSHLDYLRLFDSEFRLPKTTESIAEKTMLLGMMGIVDHQKFVSPSSKQAKIDLSFKKFDSRELKVWEKQLVLKLNEIFPGQRITITGKGVIYPDIRKALSTSLYWGFALAMFLIGAFLLFYWRDWKFTLLAILPNLFPIAGLSLFFGLSQWSLDPTTAIIFSIAVGIAFDNTVFTLNFLKDRSKSPRSLVQSFKQIHASVLQSNLSIMLCFGGFIFSSVEANQKFGILMVLSTTLAYYADTYILSSLTRLFISTHNTPDAVKSPDTTEQAPEKNHDIQIAA
ncbi:MAG: hypothetical protein AB8E15_05035 [Bdellovibrionales bacterium]